MLIFPSNTTTSDILVFLKEKEKLIDIGVFAFTILFVVYFFKGVFYDIPSINQQINYTKNTLMHEKDLFEKVKNAKPLKVMGLSEVAKELKRKEFMFDVIPITRSLTVRKFSDGRVQFIEYKYRNVYKYSSYEKFKKFIKSVNDGFFSVGKIRSLGKNVEMEISIYGN